MKDFDGKYNIKAVSNMLNIHPGTLRAWERRYQVIQPVRNDAGHRLYTDEHVKILQWIISQVEKGFTVGQAVDLLNKDELLRNDETEMFAQDQMQLTKQEIKHALLNFNENGANSHLDYAFNVFSTERVVITILGSIMLDIGDMWERGEITTAHEHFVTQYIRTKIGMVFQNLPINGMLPKVVCVCGPGEQHEIGLLIFTFFLRRRGYETIYLGAGIPEEDVLQVTKEVEAEYTVISCTHDDHLNRTLMLVDYLHESLPRLTIGLGGAAVERLSEDEKAAYAEFLVGSSENSWLNWLNKRKLRKG
ncbi:MerR family transcriptional regulator [Salisediminibacterium halotolerans]|uniref:DNA-binding transcriptional regulator, MerR family n=1 Tax=Salisediminibacterium halotolerans TaxID=517425 RepID=A0A1H9P5P1_9BACI|nr:MerR family transcriptional regulator [Salisediminibacterium haloalkalitolerans]SER43411.1 DNA-binding transcriptional regulator, MerR family [Salisediminibacterium haloalkalitolerans]